MPYSAFLQFAKQRLQGAATPARRVVAPYKCGGEKLDNRTGLP